MSAIVTEEHACHIECIKIAEDTYYLCGGVCYFPS